MCHQHVSVCRAISHPTFLLLYSLVVVVDCFFPGLPAVHTDGQHPAPAPTRSSPRYANPASSMVSPRQSSRAIPAALFSTPPIKPEPGPTRPGTPSQETTAGSGTTPMEAISDGQQQRQQRERPRPDGRMEDVYDALAERLRAKIRASRRRAKAATRRGREAAGAIPECGGGGGEEARAVQEALKDGGAAVQQLPPQAGRQAQLWVAVAGAPGSGKTTLAAEVCRRVHSAETPAVCIPMDGYHLYRRELDLLPDPSEAHRKRGAHWTFDGTRFLREIRDARASGAGSFPGFDHARGDPVESQWAVDPSHAVVLVEGNYLLLKGVDPWDAASELFDETWAIRCPPEVCGERVRKRHVQTGLGDQEALDRVKDNDLPNARLVSELCPWDEVDVVIDSL